MLLYGLLAPPVSDPLLLERAARVLAALPGGPSLPDARRRLALGQPLAVGLRRDATEKLQSELAKAGLVPRIGPAPEGTLPLVPSQLVWLRPALLVPVGVLAAFVLWASRSARAPATPPSPAPSLAAADLPRQSHAPESGTQPIASPEPIPAERRLELWAQIRASATALELVGWVRARSVEPPGGPLILIGRAAGFEVVNESFGESSIHTQRRSGGENAPLVIRTVSFRLAVDRAQLVDAQEIVLDAGWGDWRSPPLVLKLPGGA